jgi:hypothetical protein
VGCTVISFIALLAMPRRRNLDPAPTSAESLPAEA